MIHCVLLLASLCQAVHSRPIVALATIHSAALVADGVTTYDTSGKYHEVDPVSRVFIGNHPSWARMAPAGAAVVTGEIWLAYRMKTSRHAWERRTWWVPMALGTAANTYWAAANSQLK